MGVDRQDRCLLARAGGDLPEELGAAHGGRVHGDLVGARAKDRRGVVRRVDPAADAERDGERFGHAVREVDGGVSPLRGGRDVEKYELVRALAVVARGEGDRIAGVPDLDETRALHHAAVLDVEAGDDALREHRLTPPSRERSPRARARPSRRSSPGGTGPPGSPRRRPPPSPSRRARHWRRWPVRRPAPARTSARSRSRRRQGRP